PGYSGLITKNPAHPLWRTLRGPRLAYELGELAEWVDLPKHLPKRKPEQIGLGRNVTVFDWLRHYAYRHIRHYKGDIRNYVLWQAHLNNKALERNGELLIPLDGREVWHIAKSVAKWTWRQFDLAASDARFSALQAHRGRKGGVASGLSRAAKNEDKRASARLMAAQGYSSRAIAASLGVNQSTVVRWLGDARSHNQITAREAGGLP
ncbi:MAG: primase C-terminal domain-containing protein, partial [Sulfurovum sp.]|nr:primase C-terminal domain-containing protein [Sulfurovum sp.]